MPTVERHEDAEKAITVWVEWPADGFTVRAQAAWSADERIHFIELHVLGAPKGRRLVTSDLLRAVPITQMLSWANGSGRAEILAAFGLLPHLGSEQRAARRKPPLRIEIPKGHRKPDRFYIRIAAAYTWLVESDGSRRPARDLAEANDVPTSTAHRWIREARRRGFLPPGVTGRAGA